MDDLMLPCLNKQLLGFECMGCGGQRALWLFLNGEFIAAFKMYPPLYTLLLLGGFLLFRRRFPVKRREKITFALVVVNLVVIIGNYILKIIL